MRAFRPQVLDDELPAGYRRVVVGGPEDLETWQAIVDHRAPLPELVEVRALEGMRERAVTWLVRIPGHDRVGLADRHAEGPPTPGVIHP